MEYLYYVATYLVLLNIVTTYRLLKTENYEVSQKIIQAILLWAIPLLGVSIVTYFLNQEPIVLSNKMQKFRIIIKILLFPWMIKIKSNANRNLGNNDVGGYQVQEPGGNRDMGNSSGGGGGGD